MVNKNGLLGESLGLAETELEFDVGTDLLELASIIFKKGSCGAGA